MMKKLCSLFIFSFFIFNLKAQENALLWEISKEGYFTSYLYGTIHLSDESVFQFGDSVLPKLYQCDAYAGEIIIQPEDLLKILPFIYEKDIKKQCRNVLNDKEYKQVSDALSEKIAEEMLVFLPFMSPYVVAILLSYPNETIETNENTLYLDMFLQEQADSLSKKLISLESIESQFYYIKNIEINDQKKHLLKIINEENLEKDMAQLIQIYVNEDLAKMKDMLLEYKDEDPLMTEEFMVDRNFIQKEGLLNAMKEQSTFTAVGAAHLVGEKGIIELLRAEGFSVTPIFK